MNSNSRKPRHVTIGASFGKGPYPDSLKVNPGTGEIQFFREGRLIEPLVSMVDQSYHRKSKEKVVRKYSVEPNNILLHPDYSIFNLDTVYVADTNTEENLSVTCVLKGKSVFGSNGEKEGVRFRSKPYLVFTDFHIKPERRAWKQLLENNLSNNDKKTALVVDSDLDLIPKFNSREIPIVDDYFLPEGVQLIYASADVGKEHMLNKVMSKADKAAKKMIERIKSGDLVVE